MTGGFIIGGIALKNRVLTAPICGFTTRAYRDILWAHGAGLIPSEMISARALVYGNKNTGQILDMEGEESPRYVQIAGSDAEIMAEAARILADAGADMLDINMGCPAPKVVRNGEGAALLRDPQKARLIAEKVVKAVNIPVTAKIRLGWDPENINCLETARLLEDSGIAAVTVHCRTRAAYYSGAADWRMLPLIKRAAGIPVIGNGDIFRPADALRMMETCGVDAVMIGRGILGNPWLAGRAAEALSGAEKGYAEQETADPRLIMEAALAHLKAEIARALKWHTDDAEGFAVRSMRNHLAFYLKGFSGAARLRDAINRINDLAGMEELFGRYLSGDTI